MNKLLIACVLGLFLVACTSLSRADEARLLELVQTATERQLTTVEVTELKELHLKSKEGTFDWERILYLLVTGVSSVFVTNKIRDGKRTKRGEAI